MKINKYKLMRIFLDKKLKSLILLSGVVLTQLINVNAQYIPIVAAKLGCLICRIFNIIFLVAGGIAALIILIAGVKWIGSGDDPSARGAAKTTIVHAIIGLIIVVVAVFLVSWVVSGFGVMLSTTGFIDGCDEECAA